MFQFGSRGSSIGAAASSARRKGTAIGRRSTIDRSPAESEELVGENGAMSSSTVRPHILA